MECSNVATSQTRAVPGPAGVFAVLRVSTAEDHGKNTHDCLAEYELLILGTSTGSPVVAKLHSSDAEWRRRISIHLDGFSRDGRRVFGILAEEGRFPLAMLFEYDAPTGKVKLIELKRGLTLLAAVKCGTAFAVAGTTESGAVALRPNTSDPCQGDYRWRITAGTGELQRIRQGEPVISLYEERVR